MDEIRIEGLELSCIVGVRQRERKRQQLVRLDLTLGLDVSPAGRTGRIGLTCDYSQVADEVTSLLRFREYRLIEVATEELAAMLFGAHGMLEHVDIRLEKPGALPGRARSASVEVRRARSHFPRRSEPTPFGARDVLLETHEAGLYLFHLDAGRELGTPIDAASRSLAWLVSGEIELGQRKLRPGDALDVGRDSRVSSRNTSEERAVLFACTQPKLEPER